MKICFVYLNIRRFACLTTLSLLPVRSQNGIKTTLMYKLESVRADLLRMRVPPATVLRLFALSYLIVLSADSS
jgi:hypothetical protein